MIFLANVLVMNGGSTFLVRTSREMKRLGVPVAVLLLRKEVDQELLSRLESSATVLYLEDFLIDKARVFRAHSGVFGLVSWEDLERALLPFGKHIHVMGVFGLVFGYRLCARFDRFRLTAGVYHQNEFLYENIDSFFSKKAAELFRALPSENVVFFNEASRNNYAKFFSKDFSASVVVPIGIDLPSSDKSAFSTESFRIVSIGNLVEFKTYNEHIIRALPTLLETTPGLRYDVYGEGSNEGFLRNLVEELGLNERVQFHGVIGYSKFGSALENSTLFVGSGTALIEAAALGVPAMIGIESVVLPETYGFISEIQGFSYNEDVPCIPKISIISLLARFFDDIDLRSSISVKCKLKAESFSVEKTVRGFLSIDLGGRGLGGRLSGLELVKMFFSLLFLGVRRKLFDDACFSNRRNQSY